MRFLVEFVVEEIEEKKISTNISVLKAPILSEIEKAIVDPLVAPTSGLRIQIYDVKKEGDKETYIMTAKKAFLFLRVFKAICQVFKESKSGKNLKVLIVTDDRPSKDFLLKYSSQVFAYEGFEIYYQKDDAGKSRISSPYAAASVVLYDDIKLIIMLTASHNELSWNGIKFYIDYPIPISGDLFKTISKKALEVNEIQLKTDFKPVIIDPERKNNDYILRLLSQVLEIKSIKGKNIVIWPYLGRAREVVDLFKRFGANVTLIEEDLNPPNPEIVVKTEKLQAVMNKANANIALLLDADRDRIAVYVKQKNDFFLYNPNEIYSALHNLLAKEYSKKIINVRTIPSDLRGDHNSFVNILTGVGYKHLGVLLYFLYGIEVDQSKIDTAILYVEDSNKNLIKFDNPDPVKKIILEQMKKQDLKEETFYVVMWEESGGHTLNILKIKIENGNAQFLALSDLPLIADKYPVPALVLITELVCRGHTISEAIDWSIKGINRTIKATDQEKIKIMKNFERNNGKSIKIGKKEYAIRALSDNTNFIDIYQIKSKDSVLYFRPSGTGPDVRFYIFGKRETHLDEIQSVMDFVKKNYS